MNIVNTYKFQGKDVLVFLIDSKTYFLGRDIAKILGFPTPGSAIHNHVKRGNRIVLKYKEFPEFRGVVWGQKSDYSNRNVISLNGIIDLLPYAHNGKGPILLSWTYSAINSMKTQARLESSKPKREEYSTDNLEERVSKLEKEVKYLKDQTEIDTKQRQKLAKVRKHRITQVVGGKNSGFYKHGFILKVYAALNRDLDKFFDVPQPNSLRKEQFDRAVNYTKHWRPSFNLQGEIDSYNK